MALEVGDKVFIGLDTEWERDPKRKFANIVLAYGLFLLCGGRSVSLFIKPKGQSRRHRLSLKRLIGLIIQKAVEQGVLDGWPVLVYLALHYGRGDLAACLDFKLLKPLLDAVRGTLATKSVPVGLDIEIDPKSGMPSEVLPRIPPRLTVNALDRSGNDHRLSVRVLDTYALVPRGASLDSLGRLLGYRKLELPEGHEPSQMARFQDERPEDFRAYLLRDAEITARYAQRFARFCAADLGLLQPPATIGAAGVRLFLKELKSMGLDRQQLFGLKSVKTLSYSRARHQRRTLQQETLGFASALIDQVASDAYSGGRTETFMTGPVGDRHLRDVDLRSAYPTAMAAIGLPNYEACEIVLDEQIGRYEASSLGFAEIEFETPDDVRFPVFGVRTERGLIFPRRGRCVATAPEIAAARHLGVTMRILTGVIIPWDLTVRPYERFVVKMLTVREALKEDGKDTLESRTAKDMANSLYGKTAQGMQASSAYDTRSGRSKPIGRSAVTSPAFAAYTTGLVRAAIAELLNSIPAGDIVVSVSTDGFLTSARVEDIGLGGPATQVLLAARRRISEQTS